LKARNLIVVLVLLVFLVPGCSNQEKKKENTQGGVPVPPKSDDFPKDIPIFPYQQQLKTQTAQRAARALFQTTSDMDAVVTFYEEKLPDQKWAKIGKVDKDGKTVITYKKEHSILHVTVEADQEARVTNVTLLLNR